jgi:hypothetical protein
LVSIPRSLDLQDALAGFKQAILPPAARMSDDELVVSPQRWHQGSSCITTVSTVSRVVTPEEHRTYTYLSPQRNTTTTEASTRQDASPPQEAGARPWCSEMSLPFAPCQPTARLSPMASTRDAEACPPAATAFDEPNITDAGYGRCEPRFPQTSDTLADA